MLMLALFGHNLQIDSHITLDNTEQSMYYLVKIREMIC